MHIGEDPPEKLRLTPLECSVLQALATSLGEPGRVLRLQWEQAAIRSRNHSGVGFVTKLKVPDGVALLPAEAVRQVSAVSASHPLLAEPAEFLVQFKEGRLATIEAYCHVGAWPADEALFSIGRMIAH
jgi:hypothetical protein